MLRIYYNRWGCSHEISGCQAFNRGRCFATPTDATASTIHAGKITSDFHCAEAASEKVLPKLLTLQFEGLTMRTYGVLIHAQGCTESDLVQLHSIHDDLETAHDTLEHHRHELASTGMTATLVMWDNSNEHEPEPAPPAPELEP